MLKEDLLEGNPSKIIIPYRQQNRGNWKNRPEKAAYWVVGESAANHAGLLSVEESQVHPEEALPCEWEHEDTRGPPGDKVTQGRVLTRENDDFRQTPTRYERGIALNDDSRRRWHTDST